MHIPSPHAHARVPHNTLSHCPLFCSNGDAYVGEWSDDTFHGKGKYSWSSGEVYEGDFSNGRREGKGCWSLGVRPWRMGSGLWFWPWELGHAGPEGLAHFR